jgi:ribosomal protein L11 methyltransferase
MAFGTGNHETTRLCCERLVELSGDPRGRRVLDVGCGSGILALSAALLGFGQVEGFDRDPDAVRVSRENAALNGLEDRVNFFEAELVAGLAGRSADIVLVNIDDINVLTRRVRQIVAAVAPGGTLIVGGIPAKEIENIRFDFGTVARNWKTDSRVRDEWCDLVITRPGPPPGAPSAP